MFDSKCDHIKVERRQRTLTNGVLVHGLQCLHCGSWTGAKKVDGTYPEYDPELKERWSDAQRDRWDSHYEAECAKRSAESAKVKSEMSAAYAEYRKTPKWKATRTAALVRDNYLCQGCLNAEAQVVHHLTYDHCGNELLFELVSLCHAYHERAHANKLGHSLEYGGFAKRFADLAEAARMVGQ